MFTVRINPKMRVNPEATTKNNPATVIPSRRVTRNSPGSSTAGPAEVPLARKRTQASTSKAGTSMTPTNKRRLSSGRLRTGVNVSDPATFARLI